ncbi:hypothetical protein [Ulvibacterium marinum]|uniref:Thiopeptide-type bacteriocin biosynthesis domain-containing protein n=1 Tax=Ulvibacterium marinum TaxID=2419782 RepID=A0A3B0BWZ6_9FLAO|nr:hypothetical protein [Ulvibacterium marinum]RKN76898.1 hypothetical protein D7Z94_24270 [Ulvibacterium marinum]
MNRKVDLKNKRSLSISIFCDHTQWHKFILNYIPSFLKKNTGIENYFLSVSKDRGSHIRLTIVSSNAEATRLALKIDAYFKKCITKIGAGDTKNVISGNGTYRDFTPNTIHYGVYDFDYTESRLQKELTTLLITIFQHYREHTIRNLVEIFIELFSMSSTSQWLTKESSVKLFERLLESEYKNLDAKLLTEVKITNKINFVENKERLVSFINQDTYESSEMEPFQKHWYYIIRNFKKWDQKKKINQEEYLIQAICNLFDFDNRITAYYLFVSAIGE